MTTQDDDIEMYLPRRGGRRYVKTGRRSGRPAMAEGERMVSQIANLRPAQIAWLRAQPDGISAAIRNAVAKAMQTDALAKQTAVPGPAEHTTNSGEFD